MRAHIFLYIKLVVILVYSNLSFAIGPFCVSHRSLGYGEFENSLEAFQQAINNNAKAVEFDIRHTKDNKPIIYHNKILRYGVDGECGVGERVSDLIREDIVLGCTLRGQKIPTLEDALELFQGTDIKLFLEFKDKVTSSDLDLIKKYYENISDKLVIISFKKKALEAVLKRRETDGFYRSVPVLLLKLKGSLKSVGDFDGLDVKKISKKTAKKIKSAGKILGVYTKNSENSIRSAIGKGVDFITTDRPFHCEELVLNYPYL